MAPYTVPLGPNIVENIEGVWTCLQWRSFPVLQSVKTDPEVFYKCVLVFQVTRMAAEVIVRSCQVLLSAKIDPEFCTKCAVVIQVARMAAEVCVISLPVL